MSTVPAEIAGIGSTQQRLRISPVFDPLKAAVGPEEYFVLSRIDGKQTIREVLIMTGLPVDKAIAIVSRLRSIGAVLLPNESEPARAINPPEPLPRGTRASSPTSPPITQRSIGSTGPIRTIQPRPPSEPMTARSTGPIPKVGGTPVPPRRSTGAVPTITATPPEPELPDMPFDLSLPGATDEERAALVEDIEVTDEDRRRILAMARLVSVRDPYALLGVPAGSDMRLLKRAYFRLSKDIHPDRFYGKRLGTFADRMNTVFEAVSRAYAKLTNPQPEGASRSASNLRSVEADKPQTPQEYAVELFTRACTLEVNGDAMNAMKLFAAALRVDPQPRYLRRAATCALAAGQPKTAVEYAKKAHADDPDDVSTARLLAQAFKAAGKLADAEEVLVMAMALKSENDVLTSELRRDLADVRRLLAAQ